MPRADCRIPIRSRRTLLVVRDQRLDDRDRLDWIWRKGEATTTAEFGDPLADAHYALCLYDESLPAPVRLFRAEVAGNDRCESPHGACWVQARAGARVLRYRNDSRTHDGIARIVLKSGDDGRARITLIGRGERLRLPALPLALPIRAQFQASSGTCWEATYSAAGVRRNDSETFAATSD